MKEKIIFLFCLLIFLSFSQTFGEELFISSVLPNTSNDTLNEYIELTNYSFSDIYLSGFSIKDKSQKIYTFNNQVIHSQESMIFYRHETMILLNNTDEELWLYDNFGVQIDYFTYATSSKDIAIITGHHSGNIPPAQDSNSGVINNPRFISTGSISDITNSGARLVGLTFTGADSVNIAWGTGDLVFSGIIASSEYFFTQLLEETNYYYRIDLLSETGGIIDSFTGSFTTLGTPIIADRLYYSDTDNNSRVDLLEIEFSKNITGNLDYSKMKIYSNTGGLSDRLINSETGIINSYEIVNNILKLRLFEQDNNKTVLNITNTTTSDLRIKSLDWLGITDLIGNPIPIFSLTSSFDSYRNVFVRENLTDLIVSNSGENLDSTGCQNLLDIPDILITFQQPSYIFQKDLGSNEYFCDQSKTECKINFSLENSFTGDFLSNNYRCEINYGTGDIMSDCNPDTYIFPYGTYNMSFKIIDKSNSANYKEKNVKLYNIYEVLVIPDPVITIQSGIDALGYCSKGDCIVNPTGEDSFIILQSSKYSCLWSFSGGVSGLVELIKCNPGYIHYGYGAFTITLKIFEAGNETNFKESSISFRNILSQSYGGGGGNSTLINTNSPHSIITLQGTISGKNKQLSGNKLTCTGLSKCSVNLTGDKSFSLDSSKLFYHWDFGNGKYSDLKNPVAVNYGNGNYQIILTIKDEFGVTDSSYFYVDVIDNQASDISKLILSKAKYKTLSQYKSKIDIGDVVFAGFDSRKTKNKKKEVVKDESIEDISLLKKFDSIFGIVGKELESINNYKIILQGKISKNLRISGDYIECFGRKNCKINLSLTGGKIEGYNYIWNYPNGEKFASYNPKSVIFNFGKYSVSLDIYNDKRELILTKYINILVSELPTKSIKTEGKSLKIKKILPFSFVFNKDILQKAVDLMGNIGNIKLSLIFVTIFILINGMAILLVRYKSIFSQL